MLRPIHRGIMKLGQERRGVYLGMHFIDTTRVSSTSSSRSGRSFSISTTSSIALARLRLADYEMVGYRDSDLVKLDMLINATRSTRSA